METNQEYMIVIPVNGLMNRVRTIISSLIVSRLMGKKLKIWWIPEPHYINCSYHDIFDDTLMWSVENKLSFPQLPRYLNEDITNDICTLRGLDKGEQMFIDDFIKSGASTKIIMAGGDFHPSNISKSEFIKMKKNIYDQLPWNNMVINISKWINVMNISDDMPQLGIHLRYGDRECYAPNKYEDEICNMIQTKNIHHIYVASDNPMKTNELCKILRKTFGDKLQLSTLSNEHTQRTTVRGMQRAAAEWLVLSKCKMIVFFTGSSFGYEACIAANAKAREIPISTLLDENAYDNRIY